MLFKRIKLIFGAGFLLLSLTVCAQPDKKTGISIIEFYLPKLADIEQKKREKRSENPYFTTASSAGEIHAKLQKLQSFVAGVFGEDSRFVLIERNSLNLVQKEKELQKSEDFIDGYVVGQGKNIGADYLLTGDFDPNSNTLSLSFFSVSEQTTVAKESIDLQKALFGFAVPLRDPVVEGARRISARVFPLLMTVVEATEVKKDKAKTLLIAGGLKRGVKKGQVLDVKIKEEREADGVVQTYYRTVAQVEVEKVEDDNFSIVAVKDGNEEVKKLLDSGKKLYCTFKL
jgi:hypothetical protein